MIWFLYALAAWIGVGALMSVAMVGKTRKPIEPLAAAIIVVINAGIIVGLVLAAQAVSS